MKVYLKQINLDMGIKEYNMYQEIPKEETGAENPIKDSTYDEFRQHLIDKINEEFLEVDDVQTPRITYVMYSNDIPIGEIAIRSKLNTYWKEHSGNIGYKIIPSMRNMGYGTQMLKLALEKCKKHNLKEVLLQCNKYNISSEKVILKNGGVLIKRSEYSNFYKIIL